MPPVPLAIFPLSLHDALPICNVVIGTGSDDYPDADWNGIGLWKLAQHKVPGSKAGEFPLRGKTLRWFCEQALQRSEEHTSELQSPCNLVCRLLLEKKNIITYF